MILVYNFENFLEKQRNESKILGVRYCTHLQM